MVIRNLFTKSNHVTDYRLYLEKHADTLQGTLVDIFQTIKLSFPPRFPAISLPRHH